jgi:hypothetical protein
MSSPLGRRSWSRSLRLVRMTGAVAEPHHGRVPPHIAAIALARLDDAGGQSWYDSANGTVFESRQPPTASALRA